MIVTGLRLLGKARGLFFVSLLIFNNITYVAEGCTIALLCYNSSMPNIKSAKKSVRQSNAKYLVNKTAKARINRWTKKVNGFIDEKKKDDAIKAFVFLTKLLDKASKNNIFSPNKVARLKSRIQTRINAL